MNSYRFRAWDEADGLHRDVGCMTYDVSNSCDASHLMIGTGLKDINGKEIFESDIVKWDDMSDGRYWRVAIVKTKPNLSFVCFDAPLIENSSAHGHSFDYGSFIYTDTHNHLEVIGNIYENEEMIKTP